MPIIFLTAKSQTEDLIRGFGAGGNDYIRKPFSVEELIVRIENQLTLHKKNTASLIDGTISLGKYIYNPVNYELTIATSTIRLSYREAQVLSMLIGHSNGIAERKKILKSVWGDDSFFNSRTLDVYIRRLRDYLKADASVKIITLKGKGYRVVIGER
jgi:DNA-binding response OmpR family regulator